MKRKQLVSLALGLTLLLSLTVPVHAEETSFPDVEGHWAREVIEKWHGMGVIGGDTVTGAFRPDDPLSRAEFAALLNRIMGYPLVEVKHFSDVPANAWYAETMSRLNSAGIIQGDGNDMVRPLDPVTRQEAAVILCRALGIEEQLANVNFNDADDIAPWAEGAVGALYNMGAVQGWEGYWDPQDPISRCQAVVLLNNLIPAVMTRPGTWSQNVDGDFYVCTKQARLENTIISGDLILTSGIDTGDVILSGVMVKGNVLVRGGGENSIHIRSNCRLEGEIILTKTIDGALRVVNESTSPLAPIQVNDGKSTVILEGNMSSVAVNCNVPVVFRNGKVETLSITAPQADLTVEKGHAVSALTIEKDASDTELTVAGAVTTLISNAAAKVNNTGKISSAHAAANGLTLTGTKPAKVTVATGITKPTDGNGKTISATIVNNAGVRYSSSSSSSSSSSGGSSSSNSSSASPSPAPSASASPSPAPSASASPSPAPSASASPSPTPSASPSPSPAPSASPSPSPAPQFVFDLTDLAFSTRYDINGTPYISLSGLDVTPVVSSASNHTFTTEATLHYEVRGFSNSVTITRSSSGSDLQDYSLRFTLPSKQEKFTLTKVSFSCTVDNGTPITAEYIFPQPITVQLIYTNGTDYDPSTIPGAPAKGYQLPSGASCLISGTSDISEFTLQGLPQFTGQNAWPAEYFIEFDHSSTQDHLGSILIDGAPAVSTGKVTIGATSQNWNFSCDPKYGTIIDSVRASDPDVSAKLTLIWNVTDTSGNIYIIKSAPGGTIPVIIN